MLSLMEDQVANNKGRKRPRDTKGQRHGIGSCLEQENIPHKLQVIVHRVAPHKNLEPMGHGVNEVRSPENRRGIRPSRKHNAPKMLNVTEKHRKSRKGHTNAHAKKH